MTKISWDKVVETALNNLEIPQIKEDYIDARCPYCGDSKTKPYARRFRINYYPQYDQYIAKCFRCGEACDIISLHSYLNGVSYLKSKKILENRYFDPQDLKERLQKKRNKILNKEIKEKSIDYELDINLEKECFSPEDNPSSRQDKRLVQYLNEFMKERQLPVKCFVAHTGRYKNRIIVPIYLNNEMVYFQGRAIFDDQVPKYLNPRTEKENIIMNSDKFDRNYNIIITEGPVDAYMINNQGTAPLGGINLTYEFIKKLRQYTNQDLIIAFDNIRKDKASKEIINRITKKNFKEYKTLKYFIMPDKFKEEKDLNDLVRKGLVNREEMYDFICNNTYSFEYLNVIAKMS